MMGRAEDGDARPADGERAVALTDALLGLEAAAFAIHIARDRGARHDSLRAPFLLFYGATAAASMAGAALHGLTTDRTSVRRRALWRLSLASIGIAALSSWWLAVRLTLAPAQRTAVERAIGVAQVPYLVLVITGDRPYRVAIIWYLPAAVGLGVGLATRLPVAADRAPAATALAGLGVTFAAAAVQMRGLGLGPRFDHNALYHSLQALGVWLFHRAARGFLARPG